VKPAKLALVINLLLLPFAAFAQSLAPPVIPHLKEAAVNIPIPGFNKAVESLYAALKKDPNGGYSAQTTLNAPGIGSIPLQMYWFGDSAKQALFIVVDKELALPKVFNNKAWKRLEGATLSDPIFSFSTVDYALDVRDMPPAFRKVVADSYFDVTSLNFTAGFQVAAKVKLGGTMKQVVEKAMNLKISEFTLRAGVVVPIPTDASGSATLAAQLAADMKNVGNTLKDLPDFFIELQPQPGTVLKAPLGMSQLTLSDATISLTAHLVLGFRGNLVLPNGRKFITFFQTPLTPAGAMDFADFQFGFTAQTLTFADYVELMTAMATPQMPGGNFIKGFDKYKAQLQAMTRPLSVFQIRNPNTIGEYRFGDATRRFPDKSLFNLLILGPTASTTDSSGQSMTGPYFQALGDPSVLGQKLASFRLTIGDSGLHGAIDSDMTLKLGPLGRTGLRMHATADVSASQQRLRLDGNVAGRSVKVDMDGTRATIDSPATCATPFELKTRFDLSTSLNLSAMFDQTPGINVDPAKIPNCAGEQLKAAYKWVSSTGSSLGGYSATQANAELKRIDDAAKAAYNATKDKARDVANSASNSANNAFKSAGNMIRKFGRKKKNKKPPDPKFHATVFDWDFYYDVSPDVVAAGVDLSTHWSQAGFWEGRSGSNEFNAKYYLNRYPAVAAGCGNDLNCAAQHWVNYGLTYGLQGSPTFSVFDLMQRYPDLPMNIGYENYDDVMDWWLNDMLPGERNGTPLSSYAGPVSVPATVGGGGGSAWSDRPICEKRPLTGFNIDYGSSIDGLQFLYGTDSRVWAGAHGRTNWRVQVVLQDGETFTAVEMSSGSRVDQLTFYTSKGRKFGPYGGGRINNNFISTPGQSIGCMVGRSGGSTDQLTFASTGPR